MAVWEGKKYKLAESENFDEYMKALGKFFTVSTSFENFLDIFKLIGDYFFSLFLAMARSRLGSSQNG